ncbi:MAG TPA: hypothetical protein VHV10_13790, partial [Ktedonobacteraceae bacterium]|nr:hypothetical protein [Ktedonobacteraceae bacterium]
NTHNSPSPCSSLQPSFLQLYFQPWPTPLTMLLRLGLEATNSALIVFRPKLAIQSPFNGREQIMMLSKHLSISHVRRCLEAFKFLRNQAQARPSL